jgi:hypothetical protein
MGYLPNFSNARWHILVALSPVLIGSAVAEDAEQFFEKKVRPLLAQHCYECHGPSRQENDLRLDHIQFLLAGGVSGPVLVPRDTSASLLLRAIGYRDNELQMPPDGELADRDQSIIQRWIDLGAPWPAEPLPKNSVISGKFDLQKRAEFWAWQPIGNPAAPHVEHARWNNCGIDRFIYTALAQANLQPTPRANRNRLVRRAYFDVAGLPPPAATVNDEKMTEAAWEQLVDALVASPRFGERWSRHWLDLVRYADSYGHESDEDIPYAWQYRDYVIRALNADVPYDQFVREHIAGDLLDNPRLNPDEKFNESIIGTGFWYLHQATPAPVDSLRDEADRIENQIDVFGKAFLGLTVACARCHDHKFDAISTKDYYALSGILKSTRQQFTYLDRGAEIADATEALESQRHDLALRFAKHLSESIEQHGETLDNWLRASREVLQGEWREMDGRPLYRPDLLFSSFEDGDVSNWQVEARYLLRANGDAYQQTAAELRPLLGKTRLDTSGRSGVPRIPGLVVSSVPFTISRNYVEFLLYGRGDGPQRSFSLIIDDQPVYQILGPSSQTVERIVWDVRPYQGQQAMLKVDDSDDLKNEYFWVDQIVFSDTPEPYALSRPIISVAREFTINVHRLRDWLRVVAERELTLLRGDEAANSADASEIRFTAQDFGQWQATGQAFGEVTRGMQIRVEEQAICAEPAGAVHSGLASRKLRGVLRSPTFILDHDTIHYHAAGVQAQLRLIIDSYQMRRFADRLFEETYTNVNTDGRFDWFSQHRRLREYRGHRAYFEIADPSDGYIAVDSIVLSNSTSQPQHQPATPVDIRSIVQRFQGGHATSDETDLLNALVDFGLIARDQQLAAAANEWASRANRLSEPMPVLAAVAGTPFNDRVHVRGSHTTLGDEVPRRMLEALRPNAESGNIDRLALAEQLVDPKNPLLARVIVNRVWQHLLGQGIVSSVDNFGVLGQRPTHAELLDYLARQFREHGWSLKWLVKEIMLSETYRMSSVPADELAERQDPTNRLLHRANLRRLEGEAIRDAMLSVAGRLDETMYGPGIPVYVPRDFRNDVTDSNFDPDDGELERDRRRSIYLKHRRNILPTLAVAFDLPTPDSTFGRRTTTNTPAQALLLMNDPFVHRQASRWAESLLQSEDTFLRRVQRLYRTALTRDPNPREINSVETFFVAQARLHEIPLEAAKHDQRVWAAFCHVIFTLKEFIYVG